MTEQDHVPPARESDPSAPPAERLAQAASADRDEAARGIAGLEAALGWEWRESTGDLLPRLADLASAPARRHRHRVVRLLARLSVLNGTSPVWRALEPRLVALLADGDPRVRRHATRLVSSAVRGHGPVLRARWDVETDRGVRHDLARSSGVDADPALLRDDDPLIRLAAAHALRSPEFTWPQENVDSLVAAVLDDAAGADSGWLHWEPRADPVSQAVFGALDLLGGDPAAATAFASGVAAGGGAPHRLAALGCAMRISRRWRVPIPVVLLDDDNSEVRRWSAILLAHLGPEAREHADRLAELADRERGGLREAALWALARQDDPRCLPGLVELLGEEDLSFNPTRGAHPVHRRLWPRPADLAEVLVPLRAHADVLRGPITARPTDPALREVLREWDSARPTTDEDRITAACRLAGIGALDADAPALARAVADSPRRIGSSRAWDLVAQDQAVRASAARLLGEPLPR
ncbi:MULTISPECIES: HEAT repeat domain-containing protein [Actinosynnema]|uniref:HEAT repeat domain-containing protein n=1 Tax=Actinosynnema TaxID=40566 RepID=UPI0020A49BDF|nr:HEAT repeat domain-containing protein [Actinosynnema pretiosum]MCP2094850.1 HEAT repeats [Actinosynnema pretiosum]